MLGFALAAALVGVGSPIVTGADYLAACQGRDPRQKVACRAYFDGVVGTAQAFHAQSFLEAGGASTFICPDDPSVNMENASLSVILADPANLTRPAALGVLAGLLKTYPCPEPEGAANDPYDLNGLNGLGRSNPLDGLEALGDDAR